MNITDYFNLNRGHENLDFVDVTLEHDTKLFIDPCLISIGSNDFCRRANIVINDYFVTLFDLYRNNSTVQQKLNIYAHAHEINATKLGYGNGNNGKAKTPEGMVNTFQNLQNILERGIPLSKAMDLPLFIKNFAEDCMSDFLTNILLKELNDFTISQCTRYEKELATPNKPYYYWDINTHSWIRYTGQCMCIHDECILLVPKNIVCKDYYYDLDHYFRMTILERYRQEQATYDVNGKVKMPTKKSLTENMVTPIETTLKISLDKTAQHPELLTRYHRRIPDSYANRILSNEELNNIVYN